MIRNILINAAIFIGCTVIFLLMFFPYGKVLEFYAEKAAAKANVTLSIGTTDAGPFGAELTSIKISEFTADKLELGYTPLSAVTHAVSAKISSEIVTGEASHKGGELKLKALIELDKIPQITEIGLGGEVALDVEVTDGKGKGKISAPKLTIPSELGPITFNDITGDLLIEKQMIGVSNLTSQGAAKINLNGNIRINQVNAGKSVIALTGTAGVAGMNKRITITGTVLEPRISVN
ncbi:hypothetical protein EP073_12805 [Geovibrio thiophilus]|uniref:Type II secretion system protein GspN n=1 Tax=Geovibrio thiophilus TaxID=139438 RepID=A0A410K1H8_9BACT|nr:hypothetical protein [Geovibrio thiophilus]QAR34252.1 hypothetical protein EP073_12805 [Geovibrio thiophilus]